jgi:hypothetical protein
MSRVAEAVATGERAAQSVADYYARHAQMPGSLAEAGFAAPLPPVVKEIALDRKHDVIAITMVAPPVEGKAVLMVLSRNSSGRLVWDCTSEEIENRYLPRRCRRNE